MPRRVSSLSLVVAATFLAGTAQGAQCSLSHATYKSPDGEFTIQFIPNPRDSAANQSNTFTVTRVGDERVFDGRISWNLGISRPNGAVQFECPEDAYTTEDFDVCTLWRGVVYQVDAGAVDYIEDEDQPAPPTILMADFGRKMRYSGYFLDVFDPGDVLMLEGCAK